MCTKCHGRANRAGPARYSVSSGILTLNSGNEAPAVPCLQLRTSPSARTNQAVSSPLEITRTMCGRRHTSSCSAPPPGAIAMQHPSQCRPALRRTASTPRLNKFRYSLTYQREMHTSMSRASSRLALAMILAAVWWTHILSCLSERQSERHSVTCSAIKLINQPFSTERADAYAYCTASKVSDIYNRKGPDMRDVRPGQDRGRNSQSIYVWISCELTSSLSQGARW